MSEDISFQLIAWIKKDQAERLEHQKRMAKKNQEDDKVYIKLIKEVLPRNIKQKERIMLLSILRAKKEHKNWSPAQRSVIANMYYKYVEQQA